jgi:hypothetical protein
MYSNEIEIPKAVITAIHHKVEDDKVQTRITVTGTLLPDLAERLGARDLIFAENGTPKGGFSSLALDTGCAAFRAILKLRLNYHGDPHRAVAYVMAIGNGDSRLRIVPLQTEIPAKDEPEEENDQERLFHPEVTRIPRTGRRVAQ